jgi:HSP20 family molecular chaperone IbpA
LSTLKKLDILLNTLDEKSRDITIYLLKERHAGIRQLTNLICASSDMEVLIKIREIINPESQKIIGKPIIAFLRSKIDLSTGEKIMFSWWADEDLSSSAQTEELVDVIDEKNLLIVVAALPSKEKDINVRLTGSLLIISGQKYYKEVSLSCLVEEKMDKTINNGVLEVKLNKRGIDYAHRN